MKKSIISLNNIKENKKHKQNAEDDMKILNNKIKIAQINGYKEIKMYEKLVTEFIDKIRDLVLFRKSMDDIMTNQIRFIMIDEFLESFIKPIFEGNRPAFTSEEDFDLIRKNMYSNLIKKYIDNDTEKPIF